MVFLGVAQAHEFWLRPQKFRYEAGEKMFVDFMVGENFGGEFWDLTRHKVEKIALHNRIGSTDLLNKVNKTSGKNIEYVFHNVGTHLLTMESNDAYIELEPEKFNEYLEEDGLGYIKEERARRGEENKTSRELYRRFAKLLVQAGARTDDTYKKITGQKLEIVPSQNPYDLKSGDYLECKVLYRGNPEPHALVKVWSHIGNKVFLQNIYTESDGTIKFPISNSGPWMVSTVKMLRADVANAEWQSFWSSLVFEIK